MASAGILELRRKRATTWSSASECFTLREPMGVGDWANGSGGGKKGSEDDVGGSEALDPPL